MAEQIKFVLVGQLGEAVFLRLGVFQHGVVPGFAIPVGVGVAVDGVVHLEPLFDGQSSKASSHLALVEGLLFIKSVSVLSSLYVCVQVLRGTPSSCVKQLSIILEPRGEG